MLHTKFGHPVLGLEGKQCHTSGAEKRSVKNCKSYYFYFPISVKVYESLRVFIASIGSYCSELI